MLRSSQVKRYLPSGTAKAATRRNFLKSLAAGLAAAGGVGSLNAQELDATSSSAKFVRREQLESDSGVVQSAPSVEVQLKPLELPNDTEREPVVPVVTALAIASNGNYLAVAGDDHAIRIVDIATAKTIRTVKGHTDWIHALAFSRAPESVTSDNLTLYSAGDDGRVICWNQYKPPQEILKFPFAIRSLSLSTARQLIAVGGYHDSIVLFDLAAGQYTHALKCDCGDQRTVRFSPDGSRILCGGRDGDVNVWDSLSGQKLASYRAHRGRVFTASFSADGQRITSVGEDRRLIQYQLGGRQAAPKMVVMPGKLMSMCLINDSVVALAGADNSIQLYDFESQRMLANLRDHTGTVAVMCPHEALLASGSFDTTVRIWDLSNIEAQLTGHGRPVSLAPLKVDARLQIR